MQTFLHPVISHAYPYGRMRVWNCSMCRNEHYRKGIASGTYKNGLSLTECYEFLVCTHSQTCSSYKNMHCQHQLSLLKTLQKRNIKVETC